MAGTRKGSAPSERKCSTAARRIAAMLAMPRLPAVMAPGLPRLHAAAQFQRRQLGVDLVGDVPPPVAGRIADARGKFRESRTCTSINSATTAVHHH